MNFDISVMCHVRVYFVITDTYKMKTRRMKERKEDKRTVRKRRFHGMGKKSWEKVSLPVTDMANIGEGGSML